MENYLENYSLLIHYWLEKYQPFSQFLRIPQPGTPPQMSSWYVRIFLLGICHGDIPVDVDNNQYLA